MPSSPQRLVIPEPLGPFPLTVQVRVFALELKRGFFYKRNLYPNCSPRIYNSQRPLVFFFTAPPVGPPPRPEKKNVLATQRPTSHPRYSCFAIDVFFALTPSRF